MEQVFSEHWEPVKIELRAYIEYWEKLSTEKDDQRSCTHFLAKYGGLSLYDIDMEKRYSIYDREINFLKGDGYALIGNPDHPDGSSTYHKYFCIHDDFFLQNLRNWPVFWYYIKGDSQRDINFINQCQKI